MSRYARHGIQTSHMKKNTSPMQCGAFYHVYNRGINGEDLFKEARNYPYFLKLYAKYISPVAETYAYCLLKNHFHLLIRVRSEEDVIRNTSNPNVGRVYPNVGRVLNPIHYPQNNYSVH
jgi:putative transposase